MVHIDIDCLLLFFFTMAASQQELAKIEALVRDQHKQLNAAITSSNRLHEAVHELTKGLSTTKRLVILLDHGMRSLPSIIDGYTP